MTRLLIVSPNWLGDAVMALPAIADVKRAWRNGPIAVSARPAVAPLFRLTGDVDEVIEEGASHDRSFDVALLLPNSFRAAFHARRAGIPVRWGYKSDARTLLLTRGIARPPAGTHQVDYYQHLVKALGFPNGASEPHLVVPEEHRNAGARALGTAGWDGAAPIVALAPGAAFGGSKRWPPRYFAELAQALAGDGIRAVLVGSAGDDATAREVVASYGFDRRPLLNLVGRTDVPTLAGVLTSVRALVGNDSGAVHLAAAIGVPVTAIFGPTDEQLTAPRSSSPREVLVHQVWCRPCMLRECPLDHACMRGMSVDVVADATRRML